MKREGHLGTTLLLGAFAIIGLGLLKGVVASVVMIVADRLPNQDQYIPESVIRHRRQTHSFIFILVVAVVAASTFAYPALVGQQIAIEYDILSTKLIQSTTVWLFIGGSVTISLFGHIATDALTVGGGYKVKPFWPLSSWTIAFGICSSDDKWWNAALMSSGITAFLAAILHEFYYSVLLPIIGM